MADDHREECDGANCDYYGCDLIPVEELQQRVIDLWLGNDCWIPGADWKRLAKALGVDPERLQNDRTRRVRERASWKSGRQLRWDGAPDGHELVSFVRTNLDGTVQVRNDHYGIRDIPRDQLLEL